MTATYIIHDEVNGQANLEFIDSETQFSRFRTINTLGATEEEKIIIFDQHLRTFSYRISIGMIKDNEETAAPLIPPTENQQ